METGGGTGESVNEINSFTLSVLLEGCHARRARVLVVPSKEPILGFFDMTEVASLVGLCRLDQEAAKRLDADVVLVMVVLDLANDRLLEKVDLRGLAW